jgi:NAD(P)-dependent dehydrogenase (short-subunit alcohol dehydrogenase family)
MRIHNGRVRTRPEIVVITGASAGVGRATVRVFARRGAHLGLIARGRDGLEGARREVEALGGTALVLPTDVADADQIEAAASAVEAHLGPIDIWINNAMVSVFSPVQEMTPAEFRRVTEVTYLGYVYGTLAALKRMLPRDRGVIVQAGSALAYRGIPLQAAYFGAKHAIQGFMDALRCELLHDGSQVQVTMVQMPAFNTPQFGWVKSRLPHKAQPVPPIYQPEVAAKAIVWAAHHPRRELFVGFSTVKAIIGNKLAPWLGDWYLARQGYTAQQTDDLQTPTARTICGSPYPAITGRTALLMPAHDTSLQLWADTHRGWLALQPEADGATTVTVHLAFEAPASLPQPAMQPPATMTAPCNTCWSRRYSRSKTIVSIAGEKAPPWRRYERRHALPNDAGPGVPRSFTVGSCCQATALSADASS